MHEGFGEITSDSSRNSAARSIPTEACWSTSSPRFGISPSIAELRDTEMSSVVPCPMRPAITNIEIPAMMSREKMIFVRLGTAGIVCGGAESWMAMR